LLIKDFFSLDTSLELFCAQIKFTIKLFSTFYEYDNNKLKLDTTQAAQKFDLC